MSSEPGDQIRVAISEAVRIAVSMSVAVELHFNGRRTIIYPNTSIVQTMNDYDAGRWGLIESGGGGC